MLIKRHIFILNCYLSFLNILKDLHERYDVVHFDIKCDNIFVEPIDPELFITDEKINFKRLTEVPSSFRLVLADFGESIIYTSTPTLLSKGTEFNKSPEMLLNTNQRVASGYTRRL